MDLESRLANALQQRKNLQTAVDQWDRLIVELQLEIRQNKILKVEAGWD